MDDLQISLSQKEKKYREITLKIENLNASLLQETKTYEEKDFDIYLAESFKNFKEYCFIEGAKLEELRIKQNKEIIKAREKLSELFAEYKKLDIVHERKIKQEQKKIADKEREELNEAILQRHEKTEQAIHGK